MEPLFNFAYHKDMWLNEIAHVAKQEPWGNKNKILEIYLGVNFEIAKSQGKVYEDEKKNIAVWKPGYLINDVGDAIYLVYEKNSKSHYKWKFKRVHAGRSPIEDTPLQVSYKSPEFNPEWPCEIEQYNLEHILRENHERLVHVLGKPIADNKHLTIRILLGELKMASKAEAVIPNWHHGAYSFFLPLCLTKDEVELIAAITPNDVFKRYEVKTLLPPEYGYARARAVVKARNSFPGWILFDKDKLNKATIIDNKE